MQQVRPLQLTLPHYQDSPPEPAQFLLISQVPFPILGKLLGPKSHFGFRLSTTPRVLVPEAAVDEDDFAEPRKHHVGSAGQISGVQAVAETHPMHEPADRHFRLCVLASHTGHPFASFLLCKVVH
jgi:hypothetical protein